MPKELSCHTTVLSDANVWIICNIQSMTSERLTAKVYDQVCQCQLVINSYM